MNTTRTDSARTELVSIAGTLGWKHTSTYGGRRSVFTDRTGNTMIEVWWTRTAQVSDATLYDVRPNGDKVFRTALPRSGRRYVLRTWITDNA